MMMGLGRVNLLLGRIWRYQVGPILAGRVWLCDVVHAHDPLGRGDGWLGCAESSAQKLSLNKKFFFFFKYVL
jgi:hypothetical protein